ncbi:universal stress protein [Xanthocytophaga agilis]|uniref:Universal stress protein n=1 Tax=Xanthocytophaga agilis TaxID=3048010 RepID=A0AAE3UCB5_9BACT|nr:universal stress protein [Xanthocytophaga agilis]MDJ1499171.1 universal stress protein [Xanthocytophaga agilis]
MKKILVPTDFSDHAHQALLYAAKIAKVTKAEIVVVHAYHFLSADPLFSQSMYETAIDNMAKQAQSIMNEYAKRVADLIEVPCFFETKMGLAADVIIAEFQAKRADIVIMGTRGANGVLGNVLGSVTSAVIEGHTVPVLAVPNSNIGNFNTIVFGTDYAEIRNPETLRPMIDLAKSYGSHIHILNASFVPGHEDSDYAGEEQLERLFENLKICFDYTCEEDVEKALLDCMKQDSASLLVMIAHDRGFLKGLFHSSKTRSMALHGHVPLLVLPELY